VQRRKRFWEFAMPTIAALSLASCSGGGSSSTPPQQAVVGTFSTRVVNGSPDLGPVDIYIYSSTGSQPAQPIIANLQYPGISNYVAYPAGTYTIAIDQAGTTTQLGSAQLGGTTTGEIVTTAIAGQVANSTLQLQSFIEPAETSDQAALIVHHASPALNSAISPIGIGAYAATTSAAPSATATTQLAKFSIASTGGTTFASSGPATSGNVVSGEYFVSPLPSTLPSPLGFAVGAPGASGTLAAVSTSTTLSGLAANLSTMGYGLTPNSKTLAADTGNTLPAGAHLSVFLVDSTSSGPGILIGTLDP
jgi:hypothetical protein